MSQPPTLKYKSIVLLMLSILFSTLLKSCKQPQGSKENNFQHEVDNILDRIWEPNIKNIVYNVTDFGAIGDGTTDNKMAFDSAIVFCTKNGGGKVVVPKGRYLCNGPIHLRSNVEFHVKEGAEIIFSQNPKYYLPLQFVRWEGVEMFNYSPYIYAKNQQNIVITGKGKFNGSAKNGLVRWREMQKPDQKKLRKMGMEQVPVNDRIFGEGHYLRPSFIQLISCNNILISDIHITNVPFWVIHPTYCKNVTIRNVFINSYNINNDGIDIDSSEDVLIENCQFITGDDAIAIKSGRDNDGWRVNRPSKNIIIQNCTADSTLHGIAFGSEMSGGVENVYIEDFKLNKVEQYGIQFKANKDRGGYIRNIHIRDIEIDSTMTVVYFTNNYHGYSGGNSPSEFSNIGISNLSCNYAHKQAFNIVGLLEKPIRDVGFKNIFIKNANDESIIKLIQDFTFEQVTVNDKEFVFEPGELP